MCNLLIQIVRLALVFVILPLNIALTGLLHVNLTVRVNTTKRENQQEKLERYFLECVSQPLPLNSAQSNACAGAHGRADTQPFTANGITRVHGARTTNR